MLRPQSDKLSRMHDAASKSSHSLFLPASGKIAAMIAAMMLS